MYGSSNIMRSNQIKTKDADSPLDTVSSLVWHKYCQDPMFFATSWDGFVRCYNLKNVRNSNYAGSNELQLVWKMFLEHPVMCCDIHPDNILFVGMATGDIAAISLSDNQIMRVGAHEAPICGLFWLEQKKLLMSLGFDNLIRFWDVKQCNGTHEGQIILPLKTHTASYDPPYLLIGSYQSTVSIVNLKNLPNTRFPKEPHNYNKTTLQMYSKFNCSSISSAAKMIALGTIDGRTLNATFKETYDNITIESMVSKSQRRGEGRSILYGQVNAVDIGYRSGQGFCFIGGTEDLVGYNLKRKNKGPVLNSTLGATTAVKMHHSVDMLVFATGTDWTKGIQELDFIKRPRIYLSMLSTTQINDMIK